MNLLAIGLLLATMTKHDAVVTLLNSPGSSSPSRYAEAQEVVQREAKDGNPLMQFVIGVTSKDEKLAKQYADASRDTIRQMAEKKNNALAWYLLSVDANDVGFLKRAVEGGNVQALNAYGTMLVHQATEPQSAAGGLAVTNAPANPVARGYSCFRWAAAQGDPNGFVNLGTCYLRGLGCAVDPVMAHECFKSAAKAGHPEAMDYLSANYQFGHGVRKNPELSLVWRMKAKAVRGDKAAAEWLKTGK